MLVGLAVLVIAMARPQGVISVPRVEGTVILAFDVSGSMAATDLPPTRMEAAKAAARAFVAAAAADGPDRGRRLQRQRAVRPGPDRRSGPGRGGDRPARSGARDVDRRRHRVRARGDRRGGRGPGGRLLHERVTRSDRRADAGARRLARGRGRHPAERRREHDLARSAGRRQGRGRSRHPHLHRRHRQRRRGDDRRRGLQDPQPARRGPAASDRRHHRRHVLRGSRSGPAAGDLRRHPDAPRHPTRSDGGHLVRAPAPAC